MGLHFDIFGASYLAETPQKMVTFDGVDEIVTVTDPAWRSDVLGSVFIEFITRGALFTSNANETIFNMSSDNGAHNNQIRLVRRLHTSVHATNNYFSMMVKPNGGSIDQIFFKDTLYQPDTRYKILIESTGTSYRCYINSATAETKQVFAGSDSGDWFNDVKSPGSDVFSAGGMYYAGSVIANTEVDIIQMGVNNVLTNGAKRTEIMTMAEGDKIEDLSFAADFHSIYKMGEDDDIDTNGYLTDSQGLDNLTTSNMGNSNIVDVEI